MEGPGPSSSHRPLQDSLGGLENVFHLFLLCAGRDLKASWGWDSVCYVTGVALLTSWPAKTVHRVCL